MTGWTGGSCALKGSKFEQGQLALEAMKDGYGWRDLQGLPAYIRQMSTKDNAGADAGQAE